MSLRDKVAVVVGILAILGSFWAGVKYVDSRYALAQEVKKDLHEIKEKQEKEVQEIRKRQEQESKRLDYKILSDQYTEIDKRIYQIEQRYENKKMPETVKEEYNALKKRNLDKKKKLDIIEKDSR